MILWLQAFALTLAIELPIVSYALRSIEPRASRRVGLIVFANLATHPIVWFVFPQLGLTYPTMVGGAELWAWLAEALFYALAFNVTPRRALAVSFVANAVSATFGYAILRVIAR